VPDFTIFENVFFFKKFCSRQFAFLLKTLSNEILITMINQNNIS